MYYIYGRPEPTEKGSDPFELLGITETEPNLSEWLNFKIDKKAKAEQVKVLTYNNGQLYQPHNICLTLNGWATWDEQLKRYVVSDGIRQRKR